MSAGIAAVVFALGIAVLFVLDRDRRSRSSSALWIPVVWVLIAGSRTVAQWLGLAPLIVSPDEYADGSPLDRNIFAGLICAGLAVLFGRSAQVGSLVRANWPIVVFFLYGGASILWSDYPEVAFKRWTKAMGDLVMVMIVLTDPDEASAVKRFLARIGLVLAPLSVLFIKYYPELGRAYDRWEGTARYTGVATDKNMLGMICLVAGLGAAWRLIEPNRARWGAPQAGPVVAQGVLLGIVVWLLWMANSMTSLTCFILGGGVMVATSIPVVGRRRSSVHMLVLLLLCLAFAAVFVGGAGELVGRDPTLTGRTELWSELIRLVEDPLLGTGFDSFWLGKRLEQLWAVHWWRPNEAHNGYLEVFLNLGLGGLGLLIVVLVTGYLNIVRALRIDPAMGTLRLGCFVAGAVYNLTEVAFRTMSPVWVLLLLAITAVPKKGGRIVAGGGVSSRRIGEEERVPRVRTVGRGGADGVGVESAAVDELHRARGDARCGCATAHRPERKEVNANGC